MIDYDLYEEPKGVTIIEGFPGFGLVSTIAIEFLVEHLDAELIGEFVYDELPPTVAIHDGELVRPMSIWHVKDKELVILQTALNIQGLEWQMADSILELADELEADEIISLEGVASKEEETKAYTFDNEDMKEAGAEELEDSILLGITAALMLKGDNITPLFAGAHSKLPDGQAAAKIVEVLNKYLGLGLDPKPLLDKAQEFEEKLKSILQQSRQAEEEAEKKRLSYLG